MGRRYEHFRRSWKDDDFSMRWEDISGYNDMKLSVASDKFLAISPIAETTGAKYLTSALAKECYGARLWAQHFPFNLIW